MPRFPRFSRMCLRSSARMVRFTTYPSYGEAIYYYNLTPKFSLVCGAKPLSCFGTRLNGHAWLFFFTSSKCHKTSVNIVSRLLSVFAAVQKISWLSTWPVVVLVWDRCLAASYRRHPTWGPCRSQPRLDETVGNTSYNCIKDWTDERNSGANMRKMQREVKTAFIQRPKKYYYWGISPSIS